MFSTYRTEPKENGFNEDVIHFFSANGVEFFCITDGQNGTTVMNPGRIACDAFQKWILAHPFSNLNEFYYIVNDALQAVSLQFATLQSISANMVTASFTCACFFSTGEVVFYHSGNCRVYRMRGEDIQRLTNDHTVAHEMLIQGKMTSDEFQKSPLRASLTKFLGQTGQFFDAFKDASLSNDRYIFLTDGVYNTMQDDEIKFILNNAQSPEEARDILINYSGERQRFDDRGALIVWVN